MVITQGAEGRGARHAEPSRAPRARSRRPRGGPAYLPRALLAALPIRPWRCQAPAALKLRLPMATAVAPPSRRWEDGLDEDEKYEELQQLPLSFM